MPVLTLHQELPASLNFELDPKYGVASAELPASLNLGLCQELPASLNFDLAKSPCSGSSGELVEGILSAVLAADCTVLGQSGVGGSLLAEIIPPGAEFLGEWDPDVWRGVAHRPQISHDVGSVRQSCFTVPWQFPDFWRPIRTVVWQDGEFRGSKVDLWLSDLIPVPRPVDISWTFATPAASGMSAAFVLAWPQYLSQCADWETGLAVSTEYADSFVRCWPRPAMKCTGYAAGYLSWFCRTGSWSQAVHQPVPACFPWQPGQHPPFVWPLPIIPGPEPPGPEGDFSGSPDFDLTCLLPDPIWGGIMFNLGVQDVCRQALPVGWQLAITKVIIVTHDLWIKLLSDGTYLPCTAVTLNIDRDSWGWSWSATLPDRRPELVSSQHEVEISIDGHRWKGIVESMQGDRRHGRDAFRIGGRSLAATLAPPYTAPRSRMETNDRTAVQLANDELYNTGWILDWQCVDWLVNGGVFSYSDLAPIGAVKQIAGAVDGIVQAHRTDLTLAVLPRYAVSPWELAGATLDASIPLELVLTEGITWQPRTLMNGVWVSGQSQGVRVRVYRTGTDGSPYSQMIVDPLITHIDAGRERGRNVLAATGSRREVRLSMPLVDSLGVLAPGMIVEVQDSPAWRGYVDAVEIAASRIAVNQSATIEHIQEV